MKPAIKQSNGALGGRNDPRDRGLTPLSQPRPLTRSQTLGDDRLAFDQRGRIIIDDAKLLAWLVAQGFVRN